MPESLHFLSSRSRNPPMFPRVELLVLVHNLRTFWGKGSETGPTESKERPKKEAGGAELISVSFKNQRSFLTSRGRADEQISMPGALKVYTDALKFIHLLIQKVSATRCYLKAVSLGQLLGWGKQVDRGRGEEVLMPASSSEDNQWSISSP